MKVGFDNEKYLALQAEHIRQRRAQFGGKLYLEFGGKLFDDHHASRVLPGFQPDSKIRMLGTMKDEVEIVVAICAGDIEKSKMRGDLGISYDEDVLRLIDVFRSLGFYVGSVVITQYAGQPNAEAFIKRLESLGVKSYRHYPIAGYPSDVAHVVSDEGLGRNEYIETSRSVVVVTAPGPGSGKMATCLSQLYHEHKRGIRAGYAKYETFPIWNLPLKHPVNLAYEAATADLNDVNMIDPFHLEAYGKTTVNYNRDVEVFPVLNAMFQKIQGESPYKSPTDMGVNMAGFAIVDDEVCCQASRHEIVRRYYTAACDRVKGKCDESVVRKLELLMQQAHVAPEQCPSVVASLKKAEETGTVAGALTLPDGTARTTLEYFRDVFLPAMQIPAEQLVVIPVPDSMDDTAQFHAISQLLGYIESGDTLSIDLSGGLRDTAMLLITAARCMRDLRHVDTRRVIYAELLPDGKTRVHDSSELYSLFDLITAMDEFFSTGTARKLKCYLRQEGENAPALHILLARINQFSDDLALCRVQALGEDLARIEKALQAAPRESQNLNGLFFNLLGDRFRTEFEGLLRSAEDTLPALVRWCTDHGMYQQALTLLCEKMPAYVCSHLFVQPTRKGWDYMAEQKQNGGKAWVYPLFHFHFCRMALLQYEYPVYTSDLRLTRSKADADGNMLYGVANAGEMHTYLSRALEKEELVIDPAVRRQIEAAGLFYQQVMQYRNQINHANDNTYRMQSERILPLDVESIRQTLQDVADHLAEIAPMKPKAPAGVEVIPVTKKL